MGRAHFRAKFGLSTLYFSIVDTLFFAQNLGYKIAEALQAQGHRISQRSIYALLKDWGYKSAVDRNSKKAHSIRIETPSSSLSIAW
jgi:hypothetical protein